MNNEINKQIFHCINLLPPGVTGNFHILNLDYGSWDNGYCIFHTDGYCVYIGQQYHLKNPESYWLFTAYSKKATYHFISVKNFKPISNKEFLELTKNLYQNYFLQKQQRHVNYMNSIMEEPNG